jgi:hypothetical protein
MMQYVPYYIVCNIYSVIISVQNLNFFYNVEGFTLPQTKILDWNNWNT